MNFIDHLQWLAMFITILASWLVASNEEKKRKNGFWWFLLSNLLWIIWGIHDKAWALVALQLSLAAMNIRGAIKATHESTKNS